MKLEFFKLNCKFWFDFFLLFDNSVCTIIDALWNVAIKVVAALKRSVEFGIMKKRRGRYFLRYKGENVTNKNKKVKKYLAMEKTLNNSLTSTRPVRRKIRRKKRRGHQLKSTQDRRSLRKRAINRLAKSRRWRSTNSNKFFELYVNPRCRVSAKSSVASTQMLVQEETENCTWKLWAQE